MWKCWKKMNNNNNKKIITHCCKLKLKERGEKREEGVGGWLLAKKKYDIWQGRCNVEIYSPCITWSAHFMAQNNFKLARGIKKKNRLQIQALTPTYINIRNNQWESANPHPHPPSFKQENQFTSHTHTHMQHTTYNIQRNTHDTEIDVNPVYFRSLA